MKKTLFLILLVFVSAVSSFSFSLEGKGNMDYNFKIKPPRIKLDIILAKPRSGCETFPGFCLNDASVTFRTGPYNNYEVGTVMEYENQILKIEILKNRMGSNARNAMSGLQTYYIDQDTELPAVLTESLRAPARTTIKSGRYDIVDLPDVYLITVNCR